MNCRGHHSQCLLRRGAGWLLYVLGLLGSSARLPSADHEIPFGDKFASRRRHSPLARRHVHTLSQWQRQTRCEALRGNVFKLMTAKAPSLVCECERGPRVPNVGLGVFVGAVAPLWGVAGLRCVAPQ